jgi:uncharacterized protein (DUF58 family)
MYGSKLTPTLRGRVLLLLAGFAVGAAWLSGDADARLAAALLAAPLTVDFLLKPWHLGRCQLRVAARRAVAGAAFVETVTLLPVSRRTLREVIVREPSTDRRAAPPMLERVGPRDPAHVALICRSNQRGRLPTRTFELTSSWPLGLLQVRAAIAVAAELLTEPARAPIDTDLIDAVTRHEAGVQQARRRSGDEFHGLREHLLGEDARAVHALRSAALGVLVRRVTQGQLPADVRIVLDLRRRAGSKGRGDRRRCEWHLSLCAGLVEHWRAEGAHLQLLLLEAETRTFTVDSAVAERALFGVLAEVATVPHRPIDAALLRDFLAAAPCYWIPAGSPLARDSLRELGRPIVVGGDSE